MLDDRTHEIQVVRAERQSRAAREYEIDLIVAFFFGFAVGVLALAIYLLVR